MSQAKLLVCAPDRFDTYLSSLVWIVGLVLQVRKRRERTRSESIQLILEEHNLFFLLFDYVQQFTLMGYLSYLCFGIVGVILVGVGLESHDLLSMVHIQLELASLVIQLFVLKILLSNVSTKLRLGHVECLYTLVGIRLKLLDLT